jgi:hypothetical protein
MIVKILTILHMVLYFFVILTEFVVILEKDFMSRCLPKTAGGSTPFQVTVKVIRLNKYFSLHDKVWRAMCIIYPNPDGLVTNMASKTQNCCVKSIIQT